MFYQNSYSSLSYPFHPYLGPISTYDPSSDPQEVGVRFTKGEWALLDSSQRVLHGEVMMETSRNLACLSKKLSGFLFQIEEQKCRRNNQPVSSFQEIVNPLLVF
uniref:KRAB domain-containing protein n=1 Tax=Laticauda laticaudata TaxID=8630 RepID=A0A8C5S5E2_LATLA